MKNIFKSKKSIQKYCCILSFHTKKKIRFLLASLLIKFLINLDKLQKCEQFFYLKIKKKSSKLVAEIENQKQQKTLLKS